LSLRSLYSPVVATSHKSLLAPIAREVASRRINPLLLRILGKAFAVIALPIMAVFIPMAVVKRDWACIWIPGLVLALS
jgi:hypothetical protein